MLKIWNLLLSNLLIYFFTIKMHFPNFMKRFSSWKQERQEVQPKEKIENKTALEIWKIIRSRNYQWENFNKVVGYIENIIVWVLENDVNLLGLKHKVYTKELWVALMLPWIFGEEYLNSQIAKHDPQIEDIHQRNQVTRVSTDSLRRHYILKALDEILKISSAEEFWDKNYKIWDLEINSFEDLEQNRVQLQNIREKFENYDIPGFKEAVEYAAQNGINTNFYS